MIVKFSATIIIIIMDILTHTIQVPNQQDSLEDIDHWPSYGKGNAYN